MRGDPTWLAANQAHLVAQVDRVRGVIERTLAGEDPVDETVPDDRAPTTRSGGPASNAKGDEDRFALDEVVEAFDLSSFERDVLLMCAGIELDSQLARLVADAVGARGSAPTFGLAMAALDGAHWSAVTPGGPLRWWRLVRSTGPSVTSTPLWIDERVLHALVGIDDLDRRLEGVVMLGLPIVPLSVRLTTAARQVTVALGDRASATIVQLTGRDAPVRRSVAAASVERAGHLVVVAGRDLPDAADDRLELARLLDREAVLGRGAVLIECTDAGDEATRVIELVRRMVSRPIVSSNEPIRDLRFDGARIELTDPGIDERIAMWRRALGSSAAHHNGGLSAVATQFMLEADAIRVVADGTFVEEETAGEPGDPAATLWEAARIASRPRMDGLAQRIEPAATWDDIVLPGPQLAALHAIAAQVRQRHRVYEEWGFSRKSRRGLGISALFAGSSGTGKTMAAEVIANELRLDLYRIDLATVVSKYIGETEKNLKRLFDAAEGTGAILLFDEADALFGRRSEVRDSHDRYANIEVSYLLQRVETYQGLAILTTNQNQAIDPAFLRRIRFVVHFPFPDAAQREAIWRGIFPTSTPTHELDSQRLAQLSIAGGYIRNVAMAGAFIAADRGEPVGMGDLAEAARMEYAKLERLLTDAELRRWT